MLISHAKDNEFNAAVKMPITLMCRSRDWFKAVQWHNSRKFFTVVCWVWQSRLGWCNKLWTFPTCQPVQVSVNVLTTWSTIYIFVYIKRVEPAARGENCCALKYIHLLHILVCRWKKKKNELQLFLGLTTSSPMYRAEWENVQFSSRRAFN